MSAWGNEQQYMMQNMMGMNPMNPMMPNMMPPGNIPPLMPPMFGPPGAAMPYGVPPPNIDMNKSIEEKQKDQNRDPRVDNKEQTMQRDLTAKRPNQQDNDQNKNDRTKIRKKSKWDSNPNENNWQSQQGDNPPLPAVNAYGPGPTNMMMPPNMMPYGPPGPMMPSMDMSSMPNVSAMSGMPSMMPGMNMMMMNPSMPVTSGSQPIYLSNAALLPPLPNTQLPNRSEKPPGCRSIFIGGFPPNVTKEIINEMFGRFGNISDIKLNKQGVAQVRFENPECVDQSFFFSGSRFRYMDQMDTEATMIFIDYATNSEDQAEQNKREQASRFEPCTPASLITLGQKIKSESEFLEAAPTLEGWLERGDCNRTNANTFYNLIQASNGHIRRLYSEKIKIDEEFHTMKNSLKEKFAAVLKQFELIAKILIAAKHQSASDCFSRQQKKNIETWLKMTEEVPNIQEEFSTLFDDEDQEQAAKKVPLEKYEELKKENEKLLSEVEVYKNEVQTAKEEADRKFEIYKAQYVVQNSLHHMAASQIYPPLPPPTPKMVEPPLPSKPEPPTPDEMTTSGQPVSLSEAKIISAITAYLIIHPNGAVVDHIVSYIKIMCPFVTQGTVNHVLQKYSDVFMKKKFGKGISTEFRWCYAMFERVKSEWK